MLKMSRKQAKAMLRETGTCSVLGSSGGTRKKKESTSLDSPPEGNKKGERKPEEN